MSINQFISSNRLGASVFQRKVMILLTVFVEHPLAKPGLLNIFNRPGVAGAVLQSPPLLIILFSDSLMVC